MAATNVRRLAMELAGLRTDRIDLGGDISIRGFLLGPSSEEDLTQPWIFVLRGPPGSPYEGGTFGSFQVDDSVQIEELRA